MVGFDDVGSRADDYNCGYSDGGEEDAGDGAEGKDDDYVRMITSTVSLFRLKYWATIRVEVSLTKPTPTPTWI